jgi:ClpP class serine protease
MLASGVQADPVAEEAPAAAKDSDAKPARKAVAAVIAHIALDGSLPDGVGQPGLLADVKPHLHRIIERIDRAASDPKVKGVVLAIASPELGRARLEEIRAAIGRVRAAGKPVTAHLVGGAPGQYLVASACDSIMFAPAATLEIAGVRAEMTFFKALLDRLGDGAAVSIEDWDHFVLRFGEPDATEASRRKTRSTVIGVLQQLGVRLPALHEIQLLLQRHFLARRLQTTSEYKTI